MEEQILEIIKEESEKSNVRQFTCVNEFGYSQFERDLAKAIINRLEKPVMPKITDIIEECAKTAELYEPDEKQDYITYASRDIRKLKLKYR